MCIIHGWMGYGESMEEWMNDLIHLQIHGWMEYGYEGWLDGSVDV